MLAKTHSQNERRLDVLRGLNILDSGPEKVYDELTSLTAEICETPFGLVSLVEEDRQWFKSTCGLKIEETPIEHSVCAHAINEVGFLEISDTLQDKRTADNPICQQEGGFRFYAGAVLKTLDGWPLGTLCVLDSKPRVLNELQRQTLMVHAKNISHQFELTKALIDSTKNYDTPCVDIKFKENYTRLTPRERQIHNLILDGAYGSSSKKIGRALNISPRTVDHHRAHIMAKMEVESVAELISKSLHSGLKVL